MQFKGDHSFPELLDLESNWVAAFSSTSQDEPDLRFFSYDQNLDSDRINIALSGYDPPTRYFRELNEDNTNFKWDNALPFDVWDGLEAQFKLGLYHVPPSAATTKDVLLIIQPPVPDGMTSFKEVMPTLFWLTKCGL